MIGRAPVRRTLQYLNSGPIVLKDKIKVFSINYNTYGEHHEGAKSFVFWTLPQLQYKNPEVQVCTFKNMTPSPFIRCYFGEFWNTRWCRLKNKCLNFRGREANADWHRQQVQRRHHQAFSQSSWKIKGDARRRSHRSWEKGQPGEFRCRLP